MAKKAANTGKLISENIQIVNKPAPIVVGQFDIYPTCIISKLFDIFAKFCMMRNQIITFQAPLSSCT